MPIYENSIIYKLCHCNDLENENIYIGSTTNFRTRKNQHKNRCNNIKDGYYNLTVYQFIRDNGGWDEWQMIPIEVFPCNYKKELEAKERYHIELLKSKLNKKIPGRTKKEYYEDNKEHLNNIKKKYQKEYNKDYYEVNKEILNEKAKEKVICEHCGFKSRKNHLTRHQKSKKCLEKQNIF